MKYLKKYKIFENSIECENIIKDILLELDDDDFNTSVKYKTYTTGLAKRKDKWNSIPGTYITVYIAKSENYYDDNDVALEESKFKFTNKIYDLILDLNRYVEGEFNIIEDGYNIEYYFETSLIKEPIEHYWDDRSDHVWSVNEPIECSFYSLDDLKEFADKYDMTFVYISISYKIK